MLIAILAGEASGDRLGAGLMRQLRQDLPSVEFVGIGGELMLAQGLQPVAPMTVFAMNGFTEPVRFLPRLIKVFKRLLACFQEQQPVAFVGVDFNVFNLLLERVLRRRGIPTAHYVSPSVYAWRAGRVRRISRSAELLLCLYPFELPFYHQEPISVVFVGHPLADEIDPLAGSSKQQAVAARSLGIEPSARCIAVLPGSRMSEVKLMLTGFLEACEILQAQHVDSVFVVPCISAAIEKYVIAAGSRHPDLQLVTYRGDARRALTGCMGAIVKSGTGTLEAMLLRRPMVVSYRLGELSYQIVRRLLKSPFVALPNILAGRALVPELLQHEATPEALAAGLTQELERAARGDEYFGEFSRLHESLRLDADARAAQAVLAWIEQHRALD